MTREPNPRKSPRPLIGRPPGPEFPVQGRGILRSFVVSLALCGAGPSAQAATALWLAPADGDWDDATNWSTDPFAPDNGNGGLTFDVTIDVSGTPYSVTLDTAAVIDSFSLNSADATVHASASLQVLNTVAFDQGVYQLEGGTLSGGIWNIGAGARLNMASSSSNLLDGVTLNGDLQLTDDSAFARIHGGTTFTTAQLGGADSGLAFAPAQSLSGTILFEGGAGGYRYVAIDGSGSTMADFTVGATGAIRSASGFIGNGRIGYPYTYEGTMNLINNGVISSETDAMVVSIESEKFTNNGTLQAINGGTLDISAGSWTNTGTIALDAASTLRLGGIFDATGGIGAFSNPDGGTVSLTGLLKNTGNDLTLNSSTGSWIMDGGTIQGGTLNFADAQTLNPSDNFDNTLDGVKVNGDLTLDGFQSVVRISGGTTFNQVHLTGEYSYLAFAPGQTLNGTVLFEGGNNGERGVEMDGNDGTLTIGATGVIRTAPDLANYEYNIIGFGFDGGEMSLVNQGLISSETSQQIVMMDLVSLDNSGTLQAAADLSFLQLSTDTLINSGTIQALHRGIFAAGGDTLTNTGTMQALDNGVLGIGGLTFTNAASGLLKAGTGGLLDIEGDTWTNAGTISLDAASTVVLGGSFDITGGIGSFENPGGGLVVISGTLLNTGHDLTLDHNTGSWTLEGGTVKGGSLSFADGQRLIIDNNPYNLLDGVTVRGDLFLDTDDAVLSLQGGSTFDTAHLSGAGSALHFGDGQTLGGSILFEGGGAGGRTVGMDSEDGTLTIGPAGVIRSAPDLANATSGVNSIGHIDGGGAMTLENEGLISSETPGQTILVETASLTNRGTIQALDGGTLEISPATALSNYDSASSTLTAGVWRVVSSGTPTTLLLNRGGNITTNNASVFLSGVDSVFSEINSLAENQGTFALANGRPFTTAGDLLNSGTISLTDSGSVLSVTGAFTNAPAGLVSLQGGQLAGSNLTNSGTVSGFGSVAGRPLNHGTIEASGGALVFDSGIQGGSGTVTIDPGASLDLSAGPGGSNGDYLIHNGTTPGSLNLGANDFTVAIDYTNAAAGSGNTYDPRANVSGSGRILASGDVTQQLGGDVSGGGGSAPQLDFGNVHVGDTRTLNYVIANGGTTGPSIRGAVRNSAGTGSITDPRLSGPGVSAGGYGPLSPAADGGNMAVTFAPGTAGPLSGQTLEVLSNFGNAGPQTLSITGTAYRLASGSLTSGGSIDFGIVHVGDSVSRSLTVTNEAVNDGFSESLDASLSGAPAGISVSGNLSGLTPGNSGNTLTLGLNTSSAGSVSGSATLSFTSNGNGSSGLGQTPAGTESLNITARINHFASPLFVYLSGQGTLVRDSATSYTLDFGTIAMGDSGDGSAPTVILALTNDTASPADSLAGSFLQQAPAYTASHFDSFSGLDAGQALGGLTVTLDNSQAGVFAGTMTLSAAGENSSGYHGPLGDYVINFTGNVVPEPSGMAALLLSGAGFLLRRPRRGSHTLAIPEPCQTGRRASVQSGRMGF